MTARRQQWTPRLPGTRAGGYRTRVAAMPPGTGLHAVGLPGRGRRLPEPPVPASP
ncbi:hypothetical protein [Streptomyces roseolilacinus]|uniref:Uncharacterized protein n=1 Tax=Streptomyces roseolilacinus TaxID=66904 RepID=A0A918B120_9ACTN|nr:hypothetical protein [Streptomyces roseolilacinus]GGP97706.1 hypothetical protein GCM10010249_15280 [Streptomyces roseolilacinus]